MKICYFLLFGVMLLYFSGCKKIPREFSKPPGALIIGDTESLTWVKDLKSEVLTDDCSDYKGSSVKLNLDKDVKNDFRIWAVSGSTPGGYYNYGVQIEVLNDKFSIVVHKELDTTWKCTYQPDDTTMIVQEYNRRSTYTCPDGALLEELEIKSRATGAVLQNGDLLDEKATFSSGYFSLAYQEGISQRTSFGGMGIGSDVYDNRLVFGYWQNSGIQYIGVRKGNGKNAHYGWIKLEVKGFNEVILYEHGLQ